ncbi:MAG: glycosyltransferase [Pseudomonadota bacterium]
MRIADVCEFWSPEGGGVKTYVEARWRAASAAGHFVSVIAPAACDAVTQVPGGELIEVKAPRHPVDPRYHIFWGTRRVHAALDEARPDLVEASSPWRGAWLVASWPGAVPRTVFMHEEPVMKWAYGWFDRWFARDTIDQRVVPWFWRHLKRLYARFDNLICAAPSVAARLARADIDNTLTIPMGVDAGVFSPDNRDEDLRTEQLQRMQLPASATLLIGIGRLTAEKRWPVIVDAVRRAGKTRELGLLILGGGHASAKLARTIESDVHIVHQPPIADRTAYARMVASADALVHASNAETFGLAAAEALASGLPLVAPDEGAIADLAAPAWSESYRTGSGVDAARAIEALLARLPAARAAAAARPVRTLDAHFDDIFARYQALAASHSRQERPQHGLALSRPRGGL